MLKNVFHSLIAKIRRTSTRKDAGTDLDVSVAKRHTRPFRKKGYILISAFSSRIAPIVIGCALALCSSRAAIAGQSSPGTVIFSNNAILNPVVTFSSSGTFVLQMCASDGSKTTCSPVTVTVNPVPNVPPKLTVGPGGTIAGNPTTFNVSLTPGTVGVAAVQFDLTLPPGVSTTTASANVVAGAATTAAGKTVTGNAISATDYRVIIAGLNQTVIGSGVLASMNFQLDPSLAAGTLPMAITAITGSDANGVNVPMTGVNGIITITANAAPVVSAGPSQTITLPATAQVAGSATDDGAPNPPGALTILWSEL